MRAHAHTPARFIYRCKNFYALFLVTTSLAGARKKGKPRSVVPLNGKSGLRLERFSLLSTFILKKGESPYLLCLGRSNLRLTSPSLLQRRARCLRWRTVWGVRCARSRARRAQGRGREAAEPPTHSIADGTALRCGRVGSRHFQSPRGFIPEGSLFLCPSGDVCLGALVLGR